MPWPAIGVRDVVEGTDAAGHALGDDEPGTLVDPGRAGGVAGVDAERGPLVAVCPAGGQHVSQQGRGDTPTPPRWAGAHLADPRLPDAGGGGIRLELVDQLVTGDLVAIPEQQGDGGPERSRPGDPVLPARGIALGAAP